MKVARTQKAPPRPNTDGAGLSQGRQQLLLLVLYLAIVLAHVFTFRHSYEFPYFVTDAAQYVTTGQNIAAGHGYTVRGQFNSTNPPLYPAFLSVVISQSDDPMWPAFVWQCIVIGLVVFPAFAVAREVGLDPPVSILLAAAAGMLPHTFYSAIYMTEVLQYPLFLWTCALACRWLRQPTLSRSVWLGSLLSLLMLNKVNSAVLIVPLLVACVAKVAGMLKSGAISRRTGMQLILAPAAILFGTQAAWLVFKATHGGNSLGLYGTAARSSVWSIFSLPLFLAYASDFFLASGLLCVVPVCYFLRRRWRSDRPLVLFFGLLFAIQIIWIGVYEGGMTGYVRERLMSFSFPVVAILATRGFVDLKEYSPRLWRYWLAGVPLVLLVGFYFGNPGIPSCFETPWTYALGAGLVVPLAAEVKTIFAITAAGIVILGTVVLSTTNARRAVWMFAGCILLCNMITFASSAWVLAHGSEGAMNDRRGVVEWLSAHGARAGAKMIVVSHPAPWELRGFADPSQGLLLGCTPGKLPDMMVLWQIETILRWDVRTVCNLKELERAGRPGDLILAEEDLGVIPGIRHIADMPGTPRRLFQIAGPVLALPNSERSPL